MERGKGHSIQPPGVQRILDERHLFENWIVVAHPGASLLRRKGQTPRSDHRANYVNGYTNALWHGWLARADLQWENGE